MLDGLDLLALLEEFNGPLENNGMEVGLLFEVLGPDTLVASRTDRVVYQAPFFVQLARPIVTVCIR